MAAAALQNDPVVNLSTHTPLLKHDESGAVDQGMLAELRTLLAIPEGTAARTLAVLGMIVTQRKPEDAVGAQDEIRSIAEQAERRSYGYTDATGPDLPELNDFMVMQYHPEIDYDSIEDDYKSASKTAPGNQQRRVAKVIHYAQNKLLDGIKINPDEVPGDVPDHKDGWVTNYAKFEKTDDIAAAAVSSDVKVISEIGKAMQSTELLNPGTRKTNGILLLQALKGLAKEKIAAAPAAGGAEDAGDPELQVAAVAKPWYLRFVRPEEPSGLCRGFLARVRRLEAVPEFPTAAFESMTRQEALSMLAYATREATPLASDNRLTSVGKSASLPARIAKSIRDWAAIDPAARREADVAADTIGAWMGWCASWAASDADVDIFNITTHAVQWFESWADPREKCFAELVLALPPFTRSDGSASETECERWYRLSVASMVMFTGAFELYDWASAPGFPANLDAPGAAFLHDRVKSVAKSTVAYWRDVYFL